MPFKIGGAPFAHAGHPVPRDGALGIIRGISRPEKEKGKPRRRGFPGMIANFHRPHNRQGCQVSTTCRRAFAHSRPEDVHT